MPFVSSRCGSSLDDVARSLQSRGLYAPLWFRARRRTSGCTETMGPVGRPPGKASDTVRNADAGTVRRPSCS